MCVKRNVTYITTTNILCDHINVIFVKNGELTGT